MGRQCSTVALGHRAPRAKQKPDGRGRGRGRSRGAAKAVARLPTARDKGSAREPRQSTRKSGGEKSKAAGSEEEVVSTKPQVVKRKRKSGGKKSQAACPEEKVESTKKRVGKAKLEDSSELTDQVKVQPSSGSAQDSTANQLVPASSSAPSVHENVKAKKVKKKHVKEGDAEKKEEQVLRALSIVSVCPVSLVIVLFVFMFLIY
jgi:cobalamin biosynthesis Mg chelatase CobN